MRLLIFNATLYSPNPFPISKTPQAPENIMSSNSWRPASNMGFNTRHLTWLGSSETFMNFTEIAEWIESVFPFLQDRYDHSLSQPENQHHLKKVRENIDAFIKDMAQAEHEQHMLAKQDNKIVSCPSHNLLLAKSPGSLDFRHYSAATTCLIARYGIRGGPIQDCQDEGGWHLAAVILLVTVVVDLEHGYHFAARFKKNANDKQACDSARVVANADSAVAILSQQLHELSMQANKGRTPCDAEIEAMRLGMSSMQLSR
jgi:hypothetical protein